MITYEELKAKLAEEFIKTGKMPAGITISREEYVRVVDEAGSRAYFKRHIVPGTDRDVALLAIAPYGNETVVRWEGWDQT